MKIFLGALVFFLVFGWLVLLFSAIGLFYIGTVILSIIAALISAVLFLPKIREICDIKAGKMFCLVILLSLVASFVTCYFATPTVFGGRDQGSIGTAAIYLAKDHNLKISDPIAKDLFQKYGPGKSLNFPGFDYQRDGTLVSRFPAGYTSFLAADYGLFGLKGIQYANFLPLFFFLAIFWLILKEFFDDKITFLGFLIAATFFPFLWFAKYALTETYMLFLVWAGILFLIQYTKQKQPPFLWFSLAFFALSALARIEGITFFLLAAIYIFIAQKKKIIEVPKNFKKNIAILALLLLIIFLYLNFHDLLDSTKNVAKAFLPSSTKDSAPSANLYSFLGRIFFNYNIIAYLVFGLAGILWSILSSRAEPRDLQERSNKSAIKISRLAALARNDSLIIFFIVFPSFVYLLSPMITLDDPWLLRRFVFAVFPALIFYSIYLLNKFFRHKSFLYIVLAVLIAANSVISWRFLNLSENKALLPQIEKLSQKFGPDDLVLVDRLATDSGFSLASEPLRTLYGKNAVYFFNADDLKYINQDRYKNIYLIGQFDQENPWYADLVKDKAPQTLVPVTNNFIEPPDNQWALAQNVESKSFMGVWQIK